MKKIKIKRPGFGVITLAAALLASCSQNGDSTTEVDISSPPSISNQTESIIRVVNLTENQASDLNVATHFVEKDLFSYPITVPGVVVAAPEHIAIVSTPVNGRITTIYAHEGEEVIQGEPILEMESLEFADLAANYLEARAERIYLEQQVERLTALVERNISPQSSLDRATADLARADARVRAARARLQAVGIDNTQMERWNTRSEDERATLIIYAPIDGKINHHLIDLGQAVNANDMLLDIVNNKQVLVRGFVDPEDIPFLTPGGKAIVSQRSNRDEGRGAVSIESEITTIQPGLDEENKSIIVNSIVNTQNQWPVIGQSVRIEYEAATPDSVITVPISAIQFEGQSATVFVKRDDLTYENRPVRLQRMLRESAIIESGLSPGEEIAVSQVFSLKALGKFEEFAEE
jgi:membrane fusion protein, heavy metal efflux system